MHTPLSGAAVFGGVGMGPQEHAFRVGVDVIVATPGRLLDHFRYPYAKLQGLEVLVLDEADRMLDMGFLPDIRRILRHLPPRRQTLFFSATMPAPIVTLSKEMLHNPATINLERVSQPAIGITQAVYPVPSELKAALLAELVRRGEIRSVIAFTRTKHRANRVADYLLKQGIPSGRIHGNRSQSQRTQALEAFKAGKFPVLVATDIAARGIDVEALSHVINFDVPASPDDYVHRVGRTARADADRRCVPVRGPGRGSKPARDRARRSRSSSRAWSCPASTTRRRRRRSSRSRSSSGWRPCGPPAAPPAPVGSRDTAGLRIGGGLTLPTGAPTARADLRPGARARVGGAAVLRAAVRRVRRDVISSQSVSLPLLRRFSTGLATVAAFASQGRASTSHTRLGRRRPTSK